MIRNELKLFSYKRSLMENFEFFISRLEDIVIKMIPNLIRWENATLIITGSCNSKCIGCRYQEVYKTKKELQTYDWKKIIDNLHQFGIQNFSLIGGEALFREDWYEIASYCPGPLELTTNGILIRKNNIEKIKQVFNKIDISIDGSNRRIYKATRGVDCFNRAINAIYLLKKHGYNKNNLKISYVINKENYKDVESMSRLAKELGIPLKLSIISFGNHNNTLTNNRSLRDDIDINILIQQLINAKRIGDVNLYHVLIDYLRSKIPKRCYSSINGPLIDPVGDVFICCGPLPPLGNVLKTDFKIIYEKYQNSKLLYIHKKPKECKNCDAYRGYYEYIKEVLKSFKFIYKNEK